jgi:hypothetical protein
MLHPSQLHAYSNSSELLVAASLFACDPSVGSSTSNIVAAASLNLTDPEPATQLMVSFMQMGEDLLMSLMAECGDYAWMELSGCMPSTYYMCVPDLGSMQKGT